MRKYDYREKWKKLLTPEIVSYLSNIHEYKGEQNLFIEAKADTLTRLVEIAKIQSTEASNKIEGIYTSDERLRAIVKDTMQEGEDLWAYTDLQFDKFPKLHKSNKKPAFKVIRNENN